MVASSQSDKGQSRISPIYVVYGDDRRRASDALAEVVESLLAGADPQVALSTYSGDDAAWADVHDDLRTAPFLSPHRVVLVRDADEFITQYRQRLEDYLESPSATGVLVLTADKFPGTTRLAKKAAKIGEVIPCQKISVKELPGYLIDYAARRHHLKLSPAAAGVLIELAGDDSGILVGEIDKIAAWLSEPGRSPVIQPDHVEQLVGNNRQYNVFAVIDAMLDQAAAVALARLNQMLDADRDAEYAAVGAFAWHFRRLYAARVMLDRRQDSQTIIKQLRIWSHTDGFMCQVRRFNLRQIAGILHRLVHIDWAAKTGASTARSGLEKLIVQLLQTQLVMK